MNHHHLRLLNWLPVVVLGAALLLSLSGCTVPGWVDPSTIVRHVPVNHAGDPRLPTTLQRVVLLPVSGGKLVEPETTAGLDPIFADALQRQLRFEVVTVSREWCRRTFGTDEFPSTGVLPRDFLVRLTREHAADGVIFVDLTVYRDERPLAIGVRAKLATAADPRLVWSYDEVLSASDPGVVTSAQEHARASARPDLPVDLSATVFQSPTRFAAYVADTVFGTLPPR